MLELDHVRYITPLLYELQIFTNYSKKWKSLLKLQIRIH